MNAKRRVAVLSLAFLFVFSAGLFVPVSPQQISAEEKAARWGYTYYPETGVEVYTLIRNLNDREKVLCEVEVDVFLDKQKHPDAATLFSVHAFQLATGAWAYSNETLLVENGKVAERSAYRDEEFIPKPDAHFINGEYSPFYTHCYLSAKESIPTPVSRLIVRPEP